MGLPHRIFSNGIAGHRITPIHLVLYKVFFQEKSEKIKPLKYFTNIHKLLIYYLKKNDISSVCVLDRLKTLNYIFLSANSYFIKM